MGYPIILLVPAGASEVHDESFCRTGMESGMRSGMKSRRRQLSTFRFLHEALSGEAFCERERRFNSTTFVYMNVTISTFCSLENGRRQGQFSLKKLQVDGTEHRLLITLGRELNILVILAKGESDIRRTTGPCFVETYNTSTAIDIGLCF